MTDEAFKDRPHRFEDAELRAIIHAMVGQVGPWSELVIAIACDVALGDWCSADRGSLPQHLLPSVSEAAKRGWVEIDGDRIRPIPGCLEHAVRSPRPPPPARPEARTRVGRRGLRVERARGRR